MMKKLLSLLLALSLLAGLMSGCTKAIDNSGYIPTGNAILMEARNRRTLCRRKRILRS